MSTTFYKAMYGHLQAGRRVLGATVLDGALPDGVAVGHGWLFVDDEVVTGSLGAAADERLAAAVAALTRRTPSVVDDVDLGAGPCRVLLELHEPSPRLVLVGAGHIAQALAAMAVLSGFRVVVFDDRPSFVVPELFPPGTALHLGEPSTVADVVQPRGGDFVVIVTHAHAGDYDALVALAPCPTAYLGMIGSATKVAKLKQRAATEAGIPRERLDRVFSPIGLAIAAETPAEIAVSILAEMVAVLRGADPGRAGSCSVLGTKG